MLETPVTTPLIDIRKVSRSFKKGSGNDVVVLEDVDLAIKEGEIVGLLGRSGSGKSTLLRIIAGLISPSSGDAKCRGEEIEGPPLGIAMVFQSFALFPWLTVLQNVELGLEARNVERSVRRKRAEAAIDLIGLGGFENAYPRELSGGMRQRVGFARALVVDPDLLLMDEPFSALDVLTAETLRTDMIDLWMEGKLPIKSVLIVTHNIEEAVLMCDRILVFSSNPGRVSRELQVDLPHPRNRLDPVFRQMVETIYALMTQRPAPKMIAKDGSITGSGVEMPLTAVSTNLMSGLIEAIAGPHYNGRADLPELASTLQLEADELFHLGEALQLLHFATLSEGDILLTDAGKRFATIETDERKKLFAAHLLAHVPLIALINRVLNERPSHSAPAARFRNELEDHMSEDYAEETLQAAIGWSRYGELFTYDEQSETFRLEEAE